VPGGAHQPAASEDVMDLSYLFIVAIVAFVAWKLLGMRRSPQQLATIQAALDDGAVLLDVRSAAEFQGGHLPGARNVPVAGVSGVAAELKASGRPVVVYCASGTRAGMAVRVLEGAGVEVVHNLGTFGAGRDLRFTPPA
jgi:phage shock protein E